MPFSVGDLIDGHYRVEQRFAGGMGFVYIVLDEIVRKRFAIKQLSELHAANAVLLERFRREAATWLQLDYHPHIVQAHSYLPRSEAPMLILEYVNGPSLDLLLRIEKRLIPTQALGYARQFCNAMAHAHTREIPDRGIGVLHRDIKPGNIMITRSNQLKVTDFGLAKIQGDAAITSHGQFVGTVAYSSPEQLRAAGDVTRASDVYSFGAVLYQMLAGQQPFRAANPAELYHAIQATDPKPLKDLCPDLDDDFARVVMKCLEKEAGERYRDFQALHGALDGIDVRSAARAGRVCSSCGFIARRKSAKCSVCEHTRPEDAAAKPRAGKAAAKKWKCECGVSVSADAAQCPECGRSQKRGGAKRGDQAASWPASESPDAALPSAARPDAVVPNRAELKAAWDLDADKEYLVELRSNGFLLPWQLERTGYTVGRDANMKIRLEDPSIARYQLFLVRLPCGWLAMNPAANPRMEVNGWESAQHVLRPADLLHVGSTWLAYSGPQPPQEYLSPLPGKWSERVGPRALTVKAGGSSATEFLSSGRNECVLEVAGGGRFITRGQPLRIGTSPLCELQLQDAAAAPVQALLAWKPDGPHIINVTGGLVQLVGKEVLADRLLQNGDLLQIGSTPIRARVEGQPLVPGRILNDDAATKPRFALTILTGEHRGHTAILPAGQPVTLGRLPECDLIVSHDPFISRKHLELVAGESEIDIKDLGRRSGFFVNQTHFTNTAVARLGDVMVVGKTSLLVHFELDSN